MVSELKLNQDALSKIIKHPPIVTHVFAKSEATNPRLSVNLVIDIDSFNSHQNREQDNAQLERLGAKFKQNGCGQSVDCRRDKLCMNPVDFVCSRILLQGNPHSH